MFITQKQKWTNAWLMSYSEVESKGQKQTKFHLKNTVSIYRQDLNQFPTQTFISSFAIKIWIFLCQQLLFLSHCASTVAQHSLQRLMLKFCTENTNIRNLGSDKNYFTYFPIYFYTEVERKKNYFKELNKKVHMTYLELFPSQIVVPKSMELKLILNVSWDNG